MTAKIKMNLKNVSLNLPFKFTSKQDRDAPRENKVGAEIIHTGIRSYVAALIRVNIVVREGERIAVLGHNGAGKTTLLRVMSGIYQPTAGISEIDGRVSALFTSSLGLNVNATGKENVFRACKLFGIPRSRHEEVLGGVIEFSELGEFINMPMATYSAGMRARLGFALVTSVDPDILIIDEVLSTGDMAFALKARDRIMEYVTKAKALIVASHSADLMRLFCERAIWMEKGRVMMDGPFEDVWAAYYAAKN